MATGISNAAQLTTEEVEGVVIRPILQQSQVTSMNGINLPRVQEPPMRIPLITAATATTYFVDEAADIDDSTVTFSELKLLPSTIRALKMADTVSGELIRSAAVNDEPLSAIGRAISQRAAAQLDNAFIQGDPSTTTGSPTGLTVMSGTTDLTPTTVTTPDLDVLTDAIASSQRNGGSPSHVILSPEAFAYLHTLKADSAGVYLAQTDGSQGELPTLRGLTPVVSRYAPYTAADKTGTLIVLDATQLYVAMESRSPQLEISTDAKFTSDQVVVRFISRWDIGSVNPAAICTYDYDLGS